MVNFRTIIPAAIIAANSFIPNYAFGQAGSQDSSSAASDSTATEQVTVEQSFLDELVGVNDQVVYDLHMLAAKNDSLTALLQSNENSDDCDPVEYGKIKDVFLDLTYQDGSEERVQLHTERRPSGRDTGILIDGGKRAMPFKRMDVSSLRFMFTDEEGREIQPYDGTTGMKLKGTALTDRGEVGIDSVLADNYLSSGELGEFNGSIDFKWKASSVRNDSTLASIEGIIDLDKTQIVEVPVPVPVAENPNEPDTDVLTEVVDPISGENNSSGKFLTAGYQRGPNNSAGGYLKFGADEALSDILGLSASLGYLGSNSELASRETEITHLGENRVQEFSSTTLDENSALFSAGLDISLRLREGLHADIGAGYFFGDQSTVTHREIGVKDLDGNYVGDNNPVKDSETKAKTGNSAYLSAGLRGDVGNGWMLEAAYKVIGTESKAKGFNVGIGRRF